MTYAPRNLVYALTVGAGLMGCEKQPISQLEQKVQTQATGLRIAEGAMPKGGRLVNPNDDDKRVPKIDTPEKFVKTYAEILNKIYRGEAQPGEDMRTLFYGYSPLDLDDQIKTTKRMLDEWEVTIEEYVLIKTEESGDGLQLTIKRTDVGINKSSGKNEKRSAEERIPVKLIEGSYKRTHW